MFSIRLAEHTFAIAPCSAALSRFFRDYRTDDPGGTYIHISDEELAYERTLAQESFNRQATAVAAPPQAKPVGGSLPGIPRHLPPHL